MYTPLYIKTDNSLLSSLISIDNLIDYAKKNNIKSLSITDNNMYGAIEFYNKCISNDIKPIIGLELVINENSFVLYCINNIGYKNLIKLSTIHSEGKMDFEILKKHNLSLICIVPFKSLELYNNLKETYEHIYIGYKNKYEFEQIKEKNKIYINPIYYLDEKDNIYLKYLSAIRDSLLIENVKNSFNKNNIMLEQELLQLGYDLKNNYKITSMCNLEIIKEQDLIPKYRCPSSFDSHTYLKHLCIEGLKKIFGEKVPKIYADRLKKELNIINQMGFCNYFLIVWDYVKYAKENNILVGPGRGSAAGSLVSFLLNITTIDPIKHSLLFERFLNPERITMPDIDIDFEYRYRDTMVKYVIDKYGIKNVAPIITFGTLGAKQSIRDVARTMSIEIKMVDTLCKMLDSKLTLLQNYSKNPKIKNYLNINEELKILYKIATKIEGLKRHTSIHAAGIVMCDKQLDNIIPLDKSHNDFYVTGYSMEYLESLGLLKMDFLALKNLTLIKDVIDEIGINFDDIPVNDSKAIKIFTDANTIGIFQFESEGMINFLRKFKPDCVEDIIASIALYRPGPMNNIDSYIKRKRNCEKIDYIHDDLYEILKDTHGIIIYQEQIMLIVTKMASYTLGEADVLRRAMSKKKEEILIKEKDKFIYRSIKNGYDEQIAIKVYELILKFASYGFNRAHSVSYAMISIKMAYLKANYSLIFMKNLLNMVIGNSTKTNEYIYECKKLQVKLKKPDINISTNKYIQKDGYLYFPLNSIRNIGINTVEIILKEREKGKFTDIFDFINRTYGRNVTKASIEALIYSGCFENLGYNKKTLIENLDIIINYGEIGSLLENQLKPIIENIPEFTLEQRMSLEKEMFGFYISNHPITKYKLKYETSSVNEIEKNVNKNTELVLLVSRIRETQTKKNEKMCFITGIDEISSIDLVLFPKIYEKYDIKQSDIIRVFGKLEKRFDKIQLIVSDITILKED